MSRGEGYDWPSGYSSYNDWLSDDNYAGGAWYGPRTTKKKKKSKPKENTQPKPQAPPTPSSPAPVPAATAGGVPGYGGQTPTMAPMPQATGAEAIEAALASFISGPMADLLAAINKPPPPPPPPPPMYAPSNFAIGNSQNAAGVRPNRSAASTGNSKQRGVSKYNQSSMFQPIMSTLGIKV